MRVALFKHNLVHANNAKKGHNYLCPFCHHLVIINRSNSGYRYFSHYRHVFNCGGESSEHLMGKIQIVRFLGVRLYNIKIEKYLSPIHQWPDILVNNLMVIEFQCSPISNDALIARNRGYHRMNLKFWWILGSPYYYRRLGYRYLRKFMRYSSLVGFYLTFWLVKFNCLELRYQFREIHGKISYRSKQVRTFKELYDFMSNNHLRINRARTNVKADLELIQKKLFHQDIDTVKLQLKLSQYNYTVDSCPLICHESLVGPPIFKGKELLWRIWILLLLRPGRSLRTIYYQANYKLKFPLGFIQVRRIDDFYRQAFNNYIDLLVSRKYLMVHNNYVVSWQMPIWFRSFYDKKCFLNKNYFKGGG